MTVSSTTTPTITYNGNGSTVNFAIPFDYADDDHVVVVHTNTLGAQTTWTKDAAGDAGYTITGGSVVANTAPATGTALTIYRSTPLTQALDLQQGRQYNPNRLEDALDKLTLMIQDVKNIFGAIEAVENVDTALSIQNAANVGTALSIQNAANVENATNVNQASTVTVDLTGSGDLTAGTLVLTKIGRTVTVYWYGVTHALSEIVTTGAVIPAAYWPVGGEPKSCFYASGIGFETVRYDAGGYFTFVYGSSKVSPVDGSITWISE